MPRETLIKIACVLWPAIRPELKKLVQDTQTPIDDWVVVVLDALFQKLCQENAD